MKNDVDVLIEYANLLIGTQYKNLRDDSPIRGSYKDILYLIDRYQDIFKYAAKNKFISVKKNGVYRIETDKGIFELKRSEHDILIGIHYLKGEAIHYDLYQLDAYTVYEKFIEEPIAMTQQEYLEKIGLKNSFNKFKKKINDTSRTDYVYFSSYGNEKVKISRNGQDTTYDFDKKLKGHNRSFSYKAGAKIPYFDNLLEQIELSEKLKQLDVKEKKKK